MPVSGDLHSRRKCDRCSGSPAGEAKDAAECPDRQGRPDPAAAV